LDNPIIRISHDIIKGNFPKYGSYDGLVHVVEPRNDMWTDDPDYDGQVIAGTHKKRWKLTDRVRKAMGFTSDGPMQDELLVVRKNSKDHPNLVNGEAVWCNKTVGYTGNGELTDGYSNFEIEIESAETGQKFKINTVQGIFEELKYHTKGKHTCSANANHFARMKKDHLDFGWVITAHSAQGSQWDNVIVHDESAVFRNDADKWLYTAVSRAAEQLILVTR
jgi:exodeoxyribonuclease-5